MNPQQWADEPAAVSQAGELWIGAVLVASPRDEPLYAKMVESLFAGGRGGLVLEVGYGLGISANLIAKQHTIGHTIIELNSGVFDFAAQSGVGAELVSGDWRDHDRLNAYDLVFYDSMNFENDDPAIVQGLEEIGALMQSTGRAVFYTANVRRISDYLELAESKFQTVTAPDGGREFIVCEGPI